MIANEVKQLQLTIYTHTSVGTNCAPLIADLFLYCYERDFMLELSKTKQLDLIQRFKPNKYIH